MQEHIWIDWLKARGVTQAVIDTFSLHYGSQYEMGKSIVIPIYDAQGVFSFNKYRRDPAQGDVKPKYKYDSGSHALLYGADKIADAERVLVTEGELDALVAWSANIPAVSSTGGAGTFKEEWAELLAGKKVVLCFDNDEAGGMGMVRALKVLPEAGVLLLPDRPGIKDVSDYVGSGGDLSVLMNGGTTHFTSLQDVIDDRSKRLALWQSTFFHDAYIKEHTVPDFVTYDRKSFEGAGDDIARAKTYPINKLIKISRFGKALCIWHNEKTPSLHYYKESNTVYCFGGCSKRGDAIDVYMKLNGGTFGDAIKALL